MHDSSIEIIDITTSVFHNANLLQWAFCVKALQTGLLFKPS